MNVRLLLVTVGLLAFGNLTSPTFAQMGGPGSQPAPGSVPSGDPGVSGGVPPQSGDASQSKQTPPIQPADPDKVKHDGGKNDVDAIGNRKVGGRGLGNWYSIESDIKMGKQYAQMVDSSSKMVSDPVITEYVNRLGQNLVRNSDSQVPFTIKVIDSDEINAFALPGGFFYVNSGLILAADEEAELAGVMAHEIAHVAARHATREQTRLNYASMASIPLMFVGSWGLYEGVSAAMSLALPL